jgi:hypothetical protein
MPSDDASPNAQARVPVPPLPARTTASVKTLIPAGIVALAALGWLAVALWGDRQRAWGVLLADFLFLSCLSGGLVVWPAIVVVSRGEWMGSAQNIALAGVRLLPACLAIFVALILGVAAWAPWLSQTLENSWWLNAPFLLARDLVGLAVFSALALRFAAAMQRQERPQRLAAWLIFVYALVFSLLGIDLAMALDPHWYSLVFGIYFFISGLYIGVAGWACTTVLADRCVTSDQLDDLAKLMIAFCLLTAYLMYSQLLPIWYENMPKETRFLVPRLNWVTDWPGVSLVLLGLVYLGPLILFLPRRGKRSAPYVGLVAGVVLAAMWLERWWLVMPSLHQPLAFGLAEISGVTILLAGYWWFVSRVRQRVNHS